ncbi:MAG: response regulator [Phototrophicaceae bacterium]
MGKVLVIEDDEQNHILMNSVLETMGHQVLHARNGQEGLDLASAHRPDLIMLDLRLPLLNGWEVASILKNDQNLHQIPIIAVSVLVDAKDQHRALEAGCDDFVSKPYTLSIIRACIQQHLN